MKHLTNFSILSIFILNLIPGFATIDLLGQNFDYVVEKVPINNDKYGFSGTCMAQDKEGFMWFGTTHGLWRYDGHNFRIFRNEYDNPKSIQNDEINHIMVDREGLLWISTGKGLNRFCCQTDTFQKYTYKPYVPSTYTMRHHGSGHLLESADGHIWVSNRLGVSRFEKSTETFKHYTIIPEKGIDNPIYAQVNRIYEDNAGTLWILHGYNVISKIMQGMDSIELVNVFPCRLNVMLEDRSGRFWITTDSGLYELDRDNNTVKRYLDDPDDPGSLKSQKVKTIIEDSQENIWIRTFDGIYQYNQKLELLFYVKHALDYFPSRRRFSTTDYLFEDNSGTLWFFTLEGINKIIKRYSNFTLHMSDYLANNYVTSICLDKENNTWWAKSKEGILYRTNPDHSCTKFMISAEDYLDYSTLNDWAKVLFTSRNGSIWLGTKKGGLFYKKRGEDTFLLEKDYMALVSKYKDYPGRGIRQLMEDSEGRLWINTNVTPMFYYDRNEKQIHFLICNPDSKDRLGPVRVMHETETNGLLAAGWGLYKIVTPLIRVSDTSVMPTDVIKYRALIGGSGQNTIKHILSLHADNHGTIWVGTGTHGLIEISERVNPDSDGLNYTTKWFTLKNGLPSNSIHSILKDDQEYLWLGTSNGLSKFNLTTETATNYHTQQGLPGNYLTLETAVKTKTGEIFFGTENGVFSFHPDNIEYNPYVPPVLMTGLSIDNTTLFPGDNSVLKNSISYTDSIDLKYYQNDLSFEFVALNYIHPDLNQYKHKLEGFDNQWINTGNRNLVTYTNLRPGKYTFRATGSNNDGIWNEEGVQLNLRIHPPPWKTWYAYLSYGVLLAGLILGFVRFQTNRAKLKLEVELEKLEKQKVLEMDQLKTRFFANISHEFRTPLTLILGPLEKLKANRSGLMTLRMEAAASMKRSARRLLQLINQLLDVSKLETGRMKVQASRGDLESFVRTIILSFLSLAESKQITFTHKLTGTTEEYYFDPDKLEKILNNLISNAFKYTPDGGEVSVEMDYLENEESHGPNVIASPISRYAEIIIRDTGKGIPADKLHIVFERFFRVTDTDKRKVDGTGIGLALTRELVDLYRGKIWVESEVGKGSKFTVKLPISRELFSDEEIIEPADHQFLKSEEACIDSEIKQEPAGEVHMHGKETCEHLSETPLVLIVEDNPDLRNYISGILGEKYRKIKADNGRSGLDLAIEKIPDIIISDLMMQEMDGIDMCRQLKQDKRTNHIPVIILTAMAGQECKIAGLETGAVDYLVKPFDAEELVIKVRNLINHRQKLWEKFRIAIINEPVLTDINSPDDQLIQKILEILNRHIAEADFNADQMSQDLNMSRMQMYRKVNALTGHTPMELMRTIRLKKAASLFENGHNNIAQVMYQVGFNNQSYFAKCFRRIYVVNPSEYLKKTVQ